MEASRRKVYKRDIELVGEPQLRQGSHPQGPGLSVPQRKTLREYHLPGTPRIMRDWGKGKAAEKPTFLGVEGPGGGGRSRTEAVEL